mmetsp:Transcript_68071/g.107102  ORF Transcript_68071/g.107102 Transcript_68071/m.107102 type:complete len:490 (-) Transcript_68071:67-1536(-)
MVEHETFEPDSESTSLMLAREAAFAGPYGGAWLEHMDTTADSERHPPPPPSPSGTTSLRPDALRSVRESGGQAAPNASPRSSCRIAAPGRVGKASPQASSRNCMGGSLRPSPWSVTQLASNSITATSALAKQKGQCSGLCDRSGRRAATPQMKGLTRSSTSSPSRPLVAPASYPPPAVSSSALENSRTMPLSPSSTSVCSSSPERRFNRSRSESMGKSPVEGASSRHLSRQRVEDRGRLASSCRAPVVVPSARSASSSYSMPSARGGQQPRELWPATKSCREVLWMMAPLREALRTVLGQSQKAVVNAHPSRVATGGIAPNAKDVRQLAAAVAIMNSALTNLAACIEDDSSVKAPQATTSTSQLELHEPVGGWNDVEQDRLAQLETERLRLLKREEELKVLSVDDDDLEKVVEQLRARVGDLEAREAKVSQLRQECSSLRARIAELVAATIDHKSLEDENTRLLAQAAELQKAKMASRRCRQDSQSPAR